MTSPRSGVVRSPVLIPETQPAAGPEFYSGMDSVHNTTRASGTAIGMDAGVPLAWYGGTPTPLPEYRPRLKLKLPSPQSQDETFMIIFNPYPQYARMDFAEDVERMARWLGSIVHPAYFNAFYYKPSVSTAFRIEVFSPPPPSRVVPNTYILHPNTCACGLHCTRRVV